jgi:ACS family hexuronate transporter-like MFS transporter
MAPWIAVRYGWQWAVVVTGVFSALWLTAWLTLYRKPEQHAGVSASELAYIRAGAEESSQRIAWRELLPLRQTWAFAAGKFITDPVWWFFLFWLPKFLNSQHGLTLTELGLPLIVIYLAADAGSIGGGWLAAWFIRRGYAPGAARKFAMLCCACSVVPIMFAARVSSLWSAVALVGLAAAAHQGWSANLFTLTSDMFPRRAVASVVGIGGFAGAAGGMLISTFTGFLLETTGSYIPLFLMAGSAYLVALGVIHLLGTDAVYMPAEPPP